MGVLGAKCFLFLLYSAANFDEVRSNLSGCFDTFGGEGIPSGRSEVAGGSPRRLRDDFLTIFDGFGSPFGGHFGSILEPCRHLAGKSGHTDSQKGGLERGPESGSQKSPFWYLPGGRQECSLSYDSSIFSFSSLSLLAPFWAPFWSHFGSQVRHYTLFWSPSSPTAPPKRYLFLKVVFVWIFGAILEPCRHLAGKSGRTDSKKGGLERGPESGSKKGPF